MVDSTQMLAFPDLNSSAWRVEFVLAATIVVGLVIGRWTPRFSWVVTVVGLAVASGLALIPWSITPIEPLGAHFILDGLAASVRLVLCVGALVTALVLPGRRARLAAPLVALSALGLSLLAQAMTVGGLLLALAAVAVGGVLAARRTGGGRDAVFRWHVQLAVGFAIVVFAAVLWSGLGGSLVFRDALAGVAGRPGLPLPTIPLVLGLLLVGLLLATCGEPGRYATGEDAGVPLALTAWLTAAPMPALVVLVRHLLTPVPAAATLAPISGVVTAIAGVLTVGGFAAALASGRFERRLVWASHGLLGLSLLGFAVLVPDDAVRAGTALALVAAVAHLAVMLLAPRIHPMRARAIILTGLLLSLAAVPPLAGWRPRFTVIESLLAGDAMVACGLAGLGTLLGFVVYLVPLVPIWRGELEIDAETDQPRRSWFSLVTAAVLLALTFVSACGHAPFEQGPRDDTQALATVFASEAIDAAPMDAGSLVITRDGLNVLVFVEDEGQSLQAVLPCTRRGLGDVGAVARWNATRRFGRAYIDEDGRPVLAADLVVDPAVSDAVIAAWGGLVLDMSWAFVDEVWPLPEQPHNPVNE